MLSAGITTVGEYHYVHHGTGRFDLDATVIKAAKYVGIRIVLIQVGGRAYRKVAIDSLRESWLHRRGTAPSPEKFHGLLRGVHRKLGEASRGGRADSDRGRGR